MITGWTIYWITRLDILQGMCTVGAATSGLLLVALSVILLCDEERKKSFQEGLRYWKVTFGMFIPFLLLAVFTPNSKVAAAMYVVPAIANNQKVQEMPQNLLDLSNAWIKSQTEKLTPKENK